MLKTIKTTKQMRLDELVKYIWDNGIKSKQELITYNSNSNTVVTIDISGQIAVYGAHFGNEIFTVEIEEPITEDTKLEGVQEVYIDRDDQRIEIESFRGRYSINEILDEHDVSTDSLQIYAMINDKKELVWERDGDE